ncbi:hypothetical protein [Pseudorhodobacter sp.]|uniref:hypothetical protein n=1 Tax=Pseudorhodobacter sp. TaxID=1934400 RepID=UPI0026481660|nr:hypothetical protein [Pseudorhodobacter sp.]MDN5785610.1 hypothetical protein [Pseudorhodobacter sp.]
MTVPPRVWVISGVFLATALFIAANWRFVHLAFSTAPGCVTEHATRPAANNGC